MINDRRTRNGRLIDDLSHLPPKKIRSDHSDRKMGSLAQKRISWLGKIGPIKGLHTRRGHVNQSKIGSVWPLPRPNNPCLIESLFDASLNIEIDGAWSNTVSRGKEIASGVNGRGRRPARIRMTGAKLKSRILSMSPDGT